MSKLKLKPCPFCGGEAETENRHNRYTDWWEVKCTDCNASINERYDWEFQAVEAWNTRKPMDMVEAELEKRANDNERVAGRLSGIESKKKINAWRARAEAIRDAAEIVRNAGKEAKP